jgi:ubiquinone/menaquinone biosynthesis C-methylase UbiE
MSDQGRGLEIVRVRRAYERRDGVRDRYDPRRADVIAVFANRNRAWGERLLSTDSRLGHVLEVGAGMGNVLCWALETGAARAVGLDVIEDRAESALLANPRISYVVGDGRDLPLPTASFDTVICSMLFSSILDDRVALPVAGEICRVLRPSGRVLWFDFFRQNPSNRDVRGVGRKDLTALFPAFEQHLERMVLAPPLARLLVGLPRLSALLESLPPLRAYYAGSLELRSPKLCRGDVN